MCVCVWMPSFSLYEVFSSFSLPSFHQKLLWEGVVISACPSSLSLPACDKQDFTLTALPKEVGELQLIGRYFPTVWCVCVCVCVCVLHAFVMAKKIDVSHSIIFLTHEKFPSLPPSLQATSTLYSEYVANVG